MKYKKYIMLLCAIGMTGALTACGNHQSTKEREEQVNQVASLENQESDENQEEVVMPKTYKENVNGIKFDMKVDIPQNVVLNQIKKVQQYYRSQNKKR